MFTSLSSSITGLPGASGQVNRSFYIMNKGTLRTSEGQYTLPHKNKFLPAGKTPLHLPWKETGCFQARFAIALNIFLNHCPRFWFIAPIVLVSSRTPLWTLSTPSLTAVSGQKNLPCLDGEFLWIQYLIALYIPGLLVWNIIVTTCSKSYPAQPVLYEHSRRREEVEEHMQCHAWPCRGKLVPWSSGWWNYPQHEQVKEKLHLGRCQFR